jgi:hypothetical protein
LFDILVQTWMILILNKIIYYIWNQYILFLRYQINQMLILFSRFHLKLCYILGRFLCWRGGVWGVERRILPNFFSFGLIFGLLYYYFFLDIVFIMLDNKILIFWIYYIDLYWGFRAFLLMVSMEEWEEMLEEYG